MQGKSSKKNLLSGSDIQIVVDYCKSAIYGLILIKHHNSMFNFVSSDVGHF